MKKLTQEERENIANDFLLAIGAVHRPPPNQDFSIFEFFEQSVDEEIKNHRQD